eukprot:1179167-Prorocentrum_minimum.AAC.1
MPAAGERIDQWSEGRGGNMPVPAGRDGGDAPAGALRPRGPPPGGADSARRRPGGGGARRADCPAGERLSHTYRH